MTLMTFWWLCVCTTVEVNHAISSVYEMTRHGEQLGQCSNFAVETNSPLTIRWLPAGLNCLTAPADLSKTADANDTWLVCFVCHLVVTLCLEFYAKGAFGVCDCVVIPLWKVAVPFWKKESRQKKPGPTAASFCGRGGQFRLRLTQAGESMTSAGWGEWKHQTRELCLILTTGDMAWTSLSMHIEVI